MRASIVHPRFRGGGDTPQRFRRACPSNPGRSGHPDKDLFRADRPAISGPTHTVSKPGFGARPSEVFEGALGEHTVSVLSTRMPG